MRLIRIESKEGPFLELYEALAQALQGRGTVFTPYVAIPPNARYAPPPPAEIIVRLDAPDPAETLAAVAAEYLGLGKRRLLVEAPAGAPNRLEWSTPGDANAAALLDALGGGW